VSQRAAVRRSAAKLKALDASGSYSGALKQRGQRAAVTRAANRLKAAEQSGRRRLRAGAQQGVIRSRQRPATSKPAVPKRLQRREVEQAHRDKIARQIKALPKEVRRAIGVARYGKSRPGVSEYRSFLGGKKLTTHELRGHLRDAGTRLILGIPAYGRRKLNKAERAKEAAMILEDTKALRARLAMGPVRGKVRIRMPRPANTVAKPKMAGAKGGKALRGDKKALPEKKTAKPAIRGKGRIRLKDRKNVIRNTTGQSKTLNQFNSRPIGTMILDSSYNLVPSPTRVPLRIAGPGSRESDRAYGRVATKRARALARSRKAKAVTARESGSLPARPRKPS
jgi:hypothetical protein